MKKTYLLFIFALLVISCDNNDVSHTYIDEKKSANLMTIKNFSEQEENPENTTNILFDGKNTYLYNYETNSYILKSHISEDLVFMTHPFHIYSGDTIKVGILDRQGYTFRHIKIDDKYFSIIKQGIEPNHAYYIILKVKEIYPLTRISTAYTLQLRKPHQLHYDYINYQANIEIYNGTPYMNINHDTLSYGETLICEIPDIRHFHDTESDPAKIEWRISYGNLVLTHTNYDGTIAYFKHNGETGRGSGRINENTAEIEARVLFRGKSYIVNSPTIKISSTIPRPTTPPKLSLGRTSTRHLLPNESYTIYCNESGSTDHKWDVSGDAYLIQNNGNNAIFKTNNTTKGSFKITATYIDKNGVPTSTYLENNFSSGR